VGTVSFGDRRQWILSLGDKNGGERPPKVVWRWDSPRAIHQNIFFIVYINISCCIYLSFGDGGQFEWPREWGWGRKWEREWGQFEWRGGERGSDLRPIDIPKTNILIDQIDWSPPPFGCGKFEDGCSKLKYILRLSFLRLLPKKSIYCCRLELSFKFLYMYAGLWFSCWFSIGSLNASNGNPTVKSLSDVYQNTHKIEATPTCNNNTRTSKGNIDIGSSSPLGEVKSSLNCDVALRIGLSLNRNGSRQTLSGNKKKSFQYVEDQQWGFSEI